MKPFRPLVSVFALVSLLTACSTNSIPDVAGTWSGTAITSSPFDIVFELEQAGAALTGTFTDVTSSQPPFALTGSVANDELSIVVVVATGFLNFSGELEARTISGTLTFEDSTGSITAAGIFEVTQE